MSTQRKNEGSTYLLAFLPIGQGWSHGSSLRLLLSVQQACTSQHQSIGKALELEAKGEEVLSGCHAQSYLKPVQNW